MNATPRSLPLSPKVKASHLDRNAIVYVRQSTPQQVLDHQESTARQYALADRATLLGWSRDRVITIDDDLGKSGQSIEGRPGFQRLLAEVALDRVGLILGLEMSRLARSCKDWHQLLELCGRFHVLLADADGVYDPTDYSDRLLLGLHGMMNEAELHVLKQRMYQGKNVLSLALIALWDELCRIAIRGGDGFYTANLGILGSGSDGNSRWETPRLRPDDLDRTPLLPRSAGCRYSQ